MEPFLVTNMVQLMCRQYPSEMIITRCKYLIYQLTILISMKNEYAMTFGPIGDTFFVVLLTIQHNYLYTRIGYSKQLYRRSKQYCITLSIVNQEKITWLQPEVG